MKAAAVLHDVSSAVPFGKTEIEDFFPVLIGDAAGFGAKAVDEPRKFCECGYLEDLNVLRFALDPLRVGLAGRDKQECLSHWGELAFGLQCFRGSHNSNSIIGVGRLAECGTAGGVLIIGMGVDIAEVDRIRGAIERHGEVFLRRVYTTREREYCERFKNKYERYAGRFAAKEAAMKALGTGWRRGVRWVDLEVVRETSGRPTLAITGEAAKIAQQLGVKSVALSITHTAAQALAQVIFES